MSLLRERLRGQVAKSSRPHRAAEAGSSSFLGTRPQFEGLAEESAANIDWAFLERLNHSGRAAADLWLKQEIPPQARQQNRFRFGLPF